MVSRSDGIISLSPSRLRLALFGCVLGVSGLNGYPASAETRSYVVSWFTQAVYSQDDDCPTGLNLNIDGEYRRDLAALGKSSAEVEALMNELGENPGRAPAIDLLTNRARVDGKPVNAYANPAAVADLHLHTIDAKYAYGFNLDGKGETSPFSFEDPETHERGVNNQLFRALGCTHTFRGNNANRPAFWSWVWSAMRDSMSAWLLIIEGNDLNKEGDVTVTFDRALAHATTDANGQTRADMTYSVDPDLRSHNSFHAKIVKGVITISGHGGFHMQEDHLCFPEINLTNTHLRLTLKPDGGLDGVLGGYQSWHEVYFIFGRGGFPLESSLGFDTPELYYLLKRAADADPDPTTGENKGISVAYHIEAVPAFTIQPGDTKTAQSTSSPTQVR